MVSIVVILVLTGVGVTTFSNLMRSKRLATVKSELITWLNLSRNLAITGQLPSKNLGLSFVRVDFSSIGLKAYGVKDDETAEPAEFFSKNFGDGTNVIGVGVSVSDSSGKITSFGFNKGSGRLVNSSGGFIDGPIRVSIQSESGSSLLTINDLGLINEE